MNSTSHSSVENTQLVIDDLDQQLIVLIEKLYGEKEMTILYSEHDDRRVIDKERDGHQPVMHLGPGKHVRAN